ncbi:HAD family hydrolase [Phaeovulum sp.]|uniref:HAD family hydrolase n=1 Tax=Phaeovulum sp. TaxID=2934796 RepID=UPI0039E33EA9
MTQRAVLWDMDGTLVDSEPVHARAFAGAVKELGLTLPEGFTEGLIGSSAEQVHRAMVAQTGTEISLADWLTLKWRHYKAHSTNIPRRESVSRVAEALAARGVPMAVVSNSTADEVALCLRATGLDLILPVTVSRTDLHRGKPDPEGYLLAAKRLGCAPKDCLVVEDSKLGVAAGLAAGMTVLFHPQASTPGGTTPPEGAGFLAPDGDPFVPINRFTKTGALFS